MGRLFAYLLILVSSATALATTRVTPPTLSFIANVWVGGNSEYFRLELNSDGTGLLTVQYAPDKPAVAYQVKATTISKYNIRFVLDPIDKSAEPIYARGTGWAGHMDLEIGGAGKLKWKRRVQLDHYSEIMARLEAVNRRAESYKAQQRELQLRRSN